MIARRVSSGRGAELFIAAIHAFFAIGAAGAGHWFIAGCFSGACAIGILKAVRFPEAGDEYSRALVWAEVGLGLAGLIAIWQAWSNGVRL